MKQANSSAVESIRRRMVDTLPDQQQSYKCIKEGKPLEAEDDYARKLSFINKHVGVTGEMADRIANYENPEDMPLSDDEKSKAESIQGTTIDFMSVYFLDLARAASRSIARIIFADGRPQGTGFMISPELFITNNHVISSKAEAANFLLEFNFEEDYRMTRLPNTIFTIDPEKFFITVPEDKLDFTIVAIGKKQSGPMSIEEIGYLPMFESNNKHIKGIFVNCIQHPNGNPKKLVVRENRLLARTPTTLIYSSDTMPGSSGSPIFNDDWEVTALHHWGEPYRALTDSVTASELPKNGNEGIRISAIVKQLQQEKLSGDKKKLLDEALAMQFRQPSLIVSPFLKKPESSNGVHNGNGVTRELNELKEIKTDLKNSDMENNINGQTSFTIPLTITVQLGAAVAVTPAVVNQVTKTNTEEELKTNGTVAAEKFEPDPDYGKRKGYNPAFLGIKVPLPGLSADQKNDAARNQAAKQGEDPYELKYQHFSVYMNGKRRLAYLTAVNIDGGSVITINRKTGKVTGGPESMAEAREKWYDDKRIDSEEVCEDKLYKDEPQMKFFQRGHLVKRTDPSWGTEIKAFKGQSDTFHFTNCSPQHFKFNPIKTQWAGLEDWISNTSDDENIRVSVFSGPVFDDQDPQIGYVQVPKAFWKVVAWVEDGSLHATGVIADQGKLLKDSGIIDEGESISGMESLNELPDNLPAEYHCSIKFVEEKTGLNFGDLVDVDTFTKSESIGGEGIRRVTKYSEIIKRKKEAELVLEE